MRGKEEEESEDEEELVLEEEDLSRRDMYLDTVSSASAYAAGTCQQVAASARGILSLGSTSVAQRSQGLVHTQARRKTRRTSTGYGIPIQTRSLVTVCALLKALADAFYPQKG